MEQLPDRPVDPIPQPDVPLHLGSAQVDIAMLQPDLLPDWGVIVLVQLERRSVGGVQNPESLGNDLDRSSLQVGVVGVLGSPHYGPLHGDHILAPQRLCLGVGLRVGFRVEDDLRDSAAISEVQEQQPPEVTLAVHPSHQHRIRTDVAIAKLAAIVCPLGASQRFEGGRGWLLVRHQVSCRYWAASST